MSGAPRAESELDVEQAIRNQLYGERAHVTVTRVARPARPAVLLVGGRHLLRERVRAGGMANVHRAEGSSRSSLEEATWSLL
jgi:hypothetical protein